MDTKSRLVLRPVIHRVQKFLCMTLYDTFTKTEKRCIRSLKRRHRNICLSVVLWWGSRSWRESWLENCLWRPRDYHSRSFFPSIMPQRIRNILCPLSETGYSNWVSVQHHHLTLAGAQPANHYNIKELLHWPHLRQSFECKWGNFCLCQLRWEKV
jgi:hypothetical protein